MASTQEVRQLYYKSRASVFSRSYVGRGVVKYTYPAAYEICSDIENYMIIINLSVDFNLLSLFPSLLSSSTSRLFYLEIATICGQWVVKALFYKLLNRPSLI